MPPADELQTTPMQLATLTALIESGRFKSTGPHMGISSVAAANRLRDLRDRNRLTNVQMAYLLGRMHACGPGLELTRG